MRLAWFGSRTWEAECLQPWLPFSFSLTLERPQCEIPGVGLEEILGVRRPWGYGDLSDPRLQGAAQEAGVCMEDFDAVVSYAPQPPRGSWFRNALWTAPLPLLRVWADKAATRRWLADHRLPTFPSMAVKRGEWPLFVGPMALQAPTGSCGTNTFLGDGDALRRRFETIGWPRAILSPLVDGWVINGHVAVFPHGVVEVPWPSIQLVAAFPEGACLRPLYGGNDFLAYQEMVPAADRRHVARLLYRLGELAARQGYLGVLGADLLYSPATRQVGFLEVNARLQGSTGLLTKLEEQAGLVPTAARAFYSMLGRKVAPVRHSDRLPEGEEAPVSQYLLREGMSVETSPGGPFDHRHGSPQNCLLGRLAVRERILSTRSRLLQVPESNAVLVRTAMD